MTNAVEEAVAEVQGVRELKVSSDGAWLTCGHSSSHGIADVCSITTKPKVLDVSWSTKCCSECQGAQSLRLCDPELQKIDQDNHECQLNYIGKSSLLLETQSIVKTFTFQDHQVVRKRKSFIT